jgi:hypothetical protein
MIRLLVWSAYSFFAGWICYYVAFQSYGLGVAGKNGKTEDLYTASLAAVMAIVVLHHVQIFQSIRNLTWWLLLWCVISGAMVFMDICLVEYIFGVALLKRQYTDIAGP